MTKPLGRMEKVELRDAWTREDQNFTPWLAEKENLKLLADTIHMELEPEAQEKRVGPFSADILCKDVSDNSWVVIENQLERTDHSHLGQSLTYAAGLKAKTVVWVAGRFTEEHRAALDWLNENTDDNYRFFGLEIELWRIGDSPPAPKFNVVAQPNDWRKAIKPGPSAAGLLQLKYWGALLERMQSELRPQPQYWQTFSIGRAGFSVMAIRNSNKNRIGVELNITGNHAEESYQPFLEDKDAIEKEIGGELEWKITGPKTRRIILYKNADPNNEEDWLNQHAWIKEKVELFDKVFRERVRALDPSERKEEEEE